MNNKTPARLNKAEPLTLEYNKTNLMLKGVLFIIILLIAALLIGSENTTFLLWSCV